jgi:hypothetical protein
MFGSQDPALAHELPDEAIPPPDTSPQTIGAISVMGPAIYRVDDRGESACPSGNAGHALHLAPLKRGYEYQLTDVIVNAASMRFCMIRFSAYGAGSGITNGFYEEHYADVGGYWLQTDGLLDGWWFAGLFHKVHGIWRYRLIDMIFPASLSQDTFVLNAEKH